VQGRTDVGKPGYMGPCPPPGDKPHRYIYTLYAVKTDKLDVNGESSGALVGFNVIANSLGKTTLTVSFGR
jgi:Raf kinase inhibitor-like YbhB/YbcL family protein